MPDLSGRWPWFVDRTEKRLTKVVALIALTCLLVVGAAATSILSRDSVPSAGPEIAAAVVKPPVPNRDSKQDRLKVAALAAAPIEALRTAALNETLRQAYASSAPVDIEVPKVTVPETVPAPPPRPKLVSKPPVQKNYALLSDAQIAGIKERLRLSSEQEYYWPAVEDALRAVARKIHASRRSDPHAAVPPIDPDAAEVQQLKSAAMPLLFQLREDQKQEVRKLARLIGLDKVAAQI
jgi:hypothetical protein